MAKGNHAGIVPLTLAPPEIFPAAWLMSELADPIWPRFLAVPAPLMPVFRVLSPMQMKQQAQWSGRYCGLMAELFAKERDIRNMVHQLGA